MIGAYILEGGRRRNRLFPPLLRPIVEFKFQKIVQLNHKAVKLCMLNKSTDVNIFIFHTFVIISRKRATFFSNLIVISKCLVDYKCWHLFQPEMYLNFDTPSANFPELVIGRPKIDSSSPHEGSVLNDHTFMPHCQMKPLGQNFISYNHYVRFFLNINLRLSKFLA